MSLYSKIRARLSTENKGRLSKLLILSGLKPKINKNIVSPFNEGILVFSADFEMAWAFRYSKTLASKAVEVGLKERGNVPILLNLFDKHQIPATWATVGHLFLNECARNENGIAHPEIPKPAYFDNRNWLYNSGDWYEQDPCTNAGSDPAWYAPDLIEQILSAKANHEIGCHTFSHLDFTYKNCPKVMADAELEICKTLADNKGIRLRSFVFPGGTFGNYESLKEKGFLCYRKPMKDHIDIPYIDSFGLVAIPSSLGLDKDPYGWSKEFHLKMIRKFLEKTITHKLVCHFWFHPSMATWYLDNVMPEVVRMVGEFRDAGMLRVLTMGALAEEFISTHKFISETL
ncbi:MAG: polysaccharide deacetylase family protein [Bacteroidales bacterium]